MDHILTTIIISAFIAFMCRNMAVMASYCLTYGQIFGFIKVNIAKKIDAENVNKHIIGIEKQSEGEELFSQLNDVLCNYKNNNEYDFKTRFWSFILSLLDCSFCIGFWISFFVSIVSAFLGLHFICILIIPILTFFFIEKV
jgi:hypothetical protein